EVEGYRTDVKVINLSLLNTPWYIKQSRDNEPKVPITWTDEQIDRLAPVPTKDGWLLVRDLAVQHILRANDWKRPIYFAVTIPPATYAPYRDILEFEGLAYLVVRRKGQNMFNKEKVVENVFEKYKYTSILDENWKRDGSVYLPPHTEHLIQNYAVAFLQLAIIMHRDSMYGESVRCLEIAHEISPNMPQPTQLLGWYYLDMGDTAQAIRFYQEQADQQPGNLEIRFRLAGVYERTGRYQEALEQLEYVLRLDPDSRDAAMAAVGMAIRIDSVEKARKFLSDWLMRHPEDTAAQQALDDINRQLQGDSSP
ncbi:MAG: tetratricopeptide repeat protein, partial [Candidatus Krumholzibacteria bacterium]|nr:tetratricopeptide repeat protein [Candidatus Krumholzibacteria bacterium]